LKFIIIFKRELQRAKEKISLHYPIKDDFDQSREIQIGLKFAPILKEVRKVLDAVDVKSGCDLLLKDYKGQIDQLKQKVEYYELDIVPK
jgi:hypothetical protein